MGKKFGRHRKGILKNIKWNSIYSIFICLLLHNIARRQVNDHYKKTGRGSALIMNTTFTI